LILNGLYPNSRNADALCRKLTKCFSIVRLNASFDYQRIFVAVFKEGPSRCDAPEIESQTVVGQQIFGDLR